MRNSFAFFLLFAIVMFAVTAEARIKTRKLISEASKKNKAQYLSYTFVLDKNGKLDEFNHKQNRLRIFYGSKLKQTYETLSYGMIEVGLYDFNSDKRDEAIIMKYSGGAHCCFHYYIISLEKNGLIKTLLNWESNNIELEYGGKIESLSKSKYREIITRDDRLAYEFTSFAGSPSLVKVFAYKNGKYVPATKDYPNLIRQELKSAWKEYNSALAKYHKDEKSGLHDQVYYKVQTDEELLRPAILILSYGIMLNEKRKTLEELNMVTPSELMGHLSDGVMLKLEQLLKSTSL